MADGKFLNSRLSPDLYSMMKSISTARRLRQSGRIRSARWAIAFLMGALGAAEAQQVDPLQPYLLIGESGKSVERTSRDIIQRLFLLNYELLGRHHPAGDESSEVLIVSHPSLIAATSMNPTDGLLLGVCRIAVRAEGDLTYVSVQNMDYWGRAYYGSAYPAIESALATFFRGLLGALPSYRGRFNRLYGGPRAKAITPARTVPR